MNKINKFVKKSTAGVLAVATLAGGIAPGLVFAATAEDPVNEIEVLLSEENIEISSVDVYLDEITLGLTAETATGEEILAEVEFSPGDSHITIITFDHNLEAREFVIDLSELEDHAGANGENLELVIQDVETGETFEFDTDEGVLSADFPNFLDGLFAGVGYFIMGGIMLGVDLVTTLFELGELIVIEGVIWLSLTGSLLTSIPILGPILGGLLNVAGGIWNGIFGGIFGGRNQQSFQAANNSYTHFAVMTHEGVYYIGEGLTLAQAAEVLQAGGDVWSETVAAARSAANLAGNRLPSLIQNDSRTGRRVNMYLDHILPTPRTGGNAYFGNNFRRGLRP